MHGCYYADDQYLEAKTSVRMSLDSEDCRTFPQFCRWSAKKVAFLSLSSEYSRQLQSSRLAVSTSSQTASFSSTSSKRNPTSWSKDLFGNFRRRSLAYPVPAGLTSVGESH